MGSAIDDLTTVDSIASGDIIPIYDRSAGDDRGISYSNLVTALQSSLASLLQTGIDEYSIQYSSPSATGFSVTATDGGDDNTNIWLILTPAAGYATGTIKMPAVADIVNKQQVLVTCSQAVTTLTVDGNGATGIVGAPTTIAANGYFTMKYDSTNDTWRRVG